MGRLRLGIDGGNWIVERRKNLGKGKEQWTQCGNHPRLLDAVREIHEQLLLKGYEARGLEGLIAHVTETYEQVETLVSEAMKGTAPKWDGTGICPTCDYGYEKES